MIYIGAILFLGRFDLGRIHREYGLAAQRLEPDFAITLARQEMVDFCLKETGDTHGPVFDHCLKNTTPGLPERAEQITIAMTRERNGVVKKMVIFYAMMLGGMILLPVTATYVGGALLVFLLSGLRGGTDKP
ncbi:MAG: hypothetical protein KJ950_14560 [Proteobacteria bacterium]|nr:hypothetical protein [Pseudomonadota bacterium]MBU1688990.1 hypothetical protein [Pseudomonadota bacterium]